MDHMISAAVVLAEFVDLGMAVMTACKTIGRSSGLDLIVFQTAEFKPGLLVAGLQKSAAPAAAVIVGPVRVHFDEIFFADNRLYDIAQIIGNGLTVCLANDLAGILNGKLYFQVPVPVGVDV